jgi:8-oxo-dGTP diphosphatase
MQPAMPQNDEAPASPMPAASPSWPRCGASAVIFRGDDVLLVERAKGGFAGHWSLPGGHIEPGERAIDAARREVREETGVEAVITGLLDVHDVILRRPDASLAAHYLIAVYHGLWCAGEPVARSDSREARFVTPDAVARLLLTPGLEDLIARARTLRRKES